MKRVALGIAASLGTLLAQSNPTYLISTVAGTLPEDDEAPAVSAVLGRAASLATAPDGSVYVASARGIRRISRQGVISTVSREYSASAMAVDREGRLVWVNGGPAFLRFDAAGRITAIVPRGPMPVGPLVAIATDAQDNVILCETIGNGVIRYAPSGDITLIARVNYGTRIEPPRLVAADSSGNLYVVVSAPNAQVLRISPERAATVVAGNGSFGRPA